jgi:hypothetical protein
MVMNWLYAGGDEVPKGSRGIDSSAPPLSLSLCVDTGIRLEHGMHEIAEVQ